MIYYKLIGFENYIFKDKILYRKEFITKDNRYISERVIKKRKKNKKEGYYLERNGKVKHYRFDILYHRLNKSKRRTKNN